MQKALAAASPTTLFIHFGAQCGGTGAVSVKMKNWLSSQVAWRGNNTVTKAGHQVEQGAGKEESKADVSSIDEESWVHPHTRKAYRDDMEESYGIGYATRAAESGYGDRYGEAVQAIMDKRADKSKTERVDDIEYDTTQGEPVAEKEVGRHSVASNAFSA